MTTADLIESLYPAAEHAELMRQIRAAGEAEDARLAAMSLEALRLEARFAAPDSLTARLLAAREQAGR